MGAVVVLRNLAALGLLAASVALVAWLVTRGPIGGAVSGYFRKRREYYDVERMDDAEILARKYEKRSRKRGSR